MKIVVSYLNFVFFIEVKAKSKYRILNFVFQFIKKTEWHFGYTDCPQYFYQELTSRKRSSNVYSDIIKMPASLVVSCKRQKICS